MLSNPIRAILDALGEGVLIADSEERVAFANPAAAQITGWSGEELLGREVREILADGVCRTRDGASLAVECKVRAMPDGGGSGGCVFIFSDLTERERANKTEEALKKNLDQLSKKNKYETIISSVTRSVHQSINLEEVLEYAVQSMSKNIQLVDNVVIYMTEGEEAILRASVGFPDWYIRRAGRVAYPKGATWKTIIEGKSLYSPDADADSVIGQAGRDMGIKSYLSMPIRFEESVIGALFISSYRKRAFDEDELKLLDVVACQIEMAINNAKQAESLHKALSEVENLKNRLQAENIYLQEEIKTEHNFEEIIGRSAAIEKTLRKVEQVAPTDVTILIKGETGVGKELIARAIHNTSPRKNRSLVKVNCGAISAGLFESELFGHEKGAFTGALHQRIGRFELADGGTIFLDEVGELPPDTQVKLLRVIQEGEFERVGSNRTIKVNVRIIAATNRNLFDAVKAGSFRADLFYRLNVFPLDVPPLRDRKSDIARLVNFFIAKFAKKLGKRAGGVSKETLERLIAYGWPGNIRELQNVIERAVVLSQGNFIQIDEYMPEQHPGAENPASKKLLDVERSHILATLEEAGWRIEGRRGAAEALGLHPSTLRYRMRKLGIGKASEGG